MGSFQDVTLYKKLLDLTIIFERLIYGFKGQTK